LIVFTFEDGDSLTLGIVRLVIYEKGNPVKNDRVILGLNLRSGPGAELLETAI
jgi:hypothetical protein